MEEDGKKIARLKALIGRPSFLALALTNVAECEIVSGRAGAGRAGAGRVGLGWASGHPVDKTKFRLITASPALFSPSICR